MVLLNRNRNLNLLRNQIIYFGTLCMEVMKGELGFKRGWSLWLGIVRENHKSLVSPSLFVPLQHEGNGEEAFPDLRSEI